MRNIVTFIITSIIGAMIMSCTEHTHIYDERLTDVHKMLQKSENTDSIFSILKKMRINNFSTEQDKAYYAYLYTVCVYWLNAHAEDDEFIKVALDYYSEYGDSVMKAKVFTYGAFVYESLNDRNKAIECYNKALEITPMDSIEIKSKILIHLAGLINRDKPNAEALELYEKVKDYACKANNTYILADAYVQQGWNHLYNNRVDEAIICYTETVKLMENEQWNDALMFAALNKLANCYTLKGDNKQALYYAKEAEKYVCSITNQRYINGTLCQIYIKLKQWDKAEACLALSADTLKHKGKVLYLKNAIELERAKGNFHNASDFAEIYAMWVDSMYHQQLTQNAAMYQKRYDKTKVELEKADLIVEKKHLETMLLLAGVGAVIVVLLILVLAYRKQAKLMLISKAKDEAMSKFAQELQGRIIEMQDMRLLLNEYENDAKDSLQELDEARQYTRELKNQIFEMNTVVKKVLILKESKTADLRGKKYTLNDEEFDVFIEALNVCYNGVITKIKSAIPGINNEELHMCSLICLGYPMSKVALLMGMTEESLRKRKSRLRHTKMTHLGNLTLDDLITSIVEECEKNKYQRYYDVIDSKTDN